MSARTYDQIMIESIPLENRLDAINAEIDGWWCGGFYHVEGEDNIDPAWVINLKKESVTLRRKIAWLDAELEEAL